MEKYKILKHGDTHVDLDRITEGIYGRNIPILHNPGLTKDTLINMTVDILGRMEASEEIIKESIDRIKQCKLVTVRLKEYGNK